MTDDDRPIFRQLLDPDSPVQAVVITLGDVKLVLHDGSPTAKRFVCDVIAGDISTWPRTDDPPP